METIFAQLVLLGNIKVDGVSMNIRGNCGVETGVEVGDIGSVWQERRDGFDDCKGWCVVSEVVRTSMDRTTYVTHKGARSLNSSILS